MEVVANVAALTSASLIERIFELHADQMLTPFITGKLRLKFTSLTAESPVGGDRAVIVPVRHAVRHQSPAAGFSTTAGGRRIAVDADRIGMVDAIVVVPAFRLAPTREIGFPSGIHCATATRFPAAQSVVVMASGPPPGQADWMIVELLVLQEPASAPNRRAGTR